MQGIFFTILVATMPAIGLLYYFWHKDKGEKEPLPLMRKVFLWGIVAIAPVIVAEIFLMTVPYFIWADPPLLYWVLMPFVCVALPEEYAKLVVVKRCAYQHGKFNEIMDGITYCIIASMGFAVFENIMYTFQFGVGVGILRAFTAVPAHALFSGIMGYYIGVAKFTKDPAAIKKLFRKGLFWGVLLHGLYDFLLMSGIPILILLVLPLFIFMWIYLHRLIKAANLPATKKA